MPLVPNFPPPSVNHLNHFNQTLNNSHHSLRVPPEQFQSIVPQVHNSSPQLPWSIPPIVNQNFQPNYHSGLGYAQNQAVNQPTYFPLPVNQQSVDGARRHDISPPRVEEAQIEP